MNVSELMLTYRRDNREVHLALVPGARQIEKRKGLFIGVQTGNYRLR